MRTPFPLAIVLFVLGLAPSMHANDEIAPVRMGCGIMTFDTVPCWGLGPDGKSVLGSTHGSVTIDKAGAIYTSARKGVIVFSPDGNVIRTFLGEDYSNIHDLEIREEGGVEYIYGARNNDREGIKFQASDGKIVLKLGFPGESGLDGTKFNPTAITVAPNGDIVLSDGYASDKIFKFDRSGKYLMHFGSKGNGLKQFNTAHGMTLDTRYDPPRLLICDRNHQPKGRLLHYSLEGEFIAEVVTGLGMPTSVAIQGDYVSVPDLHGRLVILDGTNTIISVLGHNPDARKGRSFGIKREDWIEGIFSGTHGSYWDRRGNLYVQDWNVSGRIMKLVRVGAKDKDGFVSIFDGKTLNGWEATPASTAGAWTVKDGAIVGDGDKGRGYLTYEKKNIADLELKLSYRFPGEGNSGISIRARKDPTGKRDFQSYHVDFGHVGIGRQVLGAWDFHTPGRREHACFRGDRLVIDKDDKPTVTKIEGAVTKGDINKGGWNAVHVIARGNNFKFFINGKPSAEFTEHLDEKRRLDRGMIQLQLHDPGMIVQFKDIRLKILD